MESNFRVDTFTQKNLTTGDNEKVEKVTANPKAKSNNPLLDHVHMMSTTNQTLMVGSVASAAINQLPK